MASQTTVWMGAMSCYEGPRPGALFSDLPRPHQREMARMVFVAVLSSAFFVTLGVLAQPLPSRSLARPIPAPEAVAAYAALVPATAAIPLDTPVHRLLRPQAARPSAPIQLASTTVAPAADTQTVSSAPARERRPNFLGRLVHGMLHPTRVIAAG